MTRTTIGLLAAAALLWLVSAIPVALACGIIAAVVGASPDAGVITGVAVWTLGAPIVFLRPVELRVARMLFGAREPTPEERARLEPVWQHVCMLAQEDLGDYVLRIEDRDEVNATAGGARIVAVTTLALSLPDDELSALLAHELGHHLDEHPIASLLTWWYSMPSLVFDAILGIASQIAWFAVFARVLFLIPVAIARLASAFVNRSAEFAADRHAARLGYGPALVKLFERLGAAGHSEKGSADPGPARLWASHPPLEDRIARLQAVPGLP